MAPAHAREPNFETMRALLAVPSPRRTPPLRTRGQWSLIRIAGDAICAKVSQLSPLDVSSSGSTIYGRWEGSYPVWPPRSAVDVIRWYGCSYDPPLMARPAWWRSTIWSDSLLFGPFYVVAIWAYWVGDKRIRIPTIIYASVIATNVFVIMFEEYYGVNHTASPTLVTLLNVPWFVIPLLALARMWAEEEPFATATSHTKNE